MSENMSISVNGQSQVPPGFRFHPTEEELLQYYLKKKVSNQNIDLNVIREVDLNKLEPWDIQEMCKIGTTPQNDWYFFSHKDKKYPTGTRTNRATGVGFWKATGRDKIIYSNGMRIGMRKTLVFYKGRAPRGLKSDWIMHEYRILDDNNTKDDATNNVSIVLINGSNGDVVVSQEEGWVVCRIFMKKNHYKTLENSEGANLDQILGEIANNINESIKLQKPNIINTDTKSSGLQESFSKLPNLESPNSTSNWQNCYQPSYLETKKLEEKVISDDYYNTEMENSAVNVMMTNWAAMDRLVASQLNCQSEALNISDPTNCINMNGNDQELQILQNLRSISSSSSFSNISNKSYSATQNYYNQIDLWSLAQSSSSNLSYSHQLCHVSNSRI